MSAPSAKDQLRDRAVKVYRYVIRGVKAPEIAQLEGLPRRTVYWLIQEGGRILGGELKMITETGLLRDLLLSHQERTKELWFNYSAAKAVRDKVLCLQRVAEEDLRALDLAERLKLIEQKAEKQNVQLDHRISYDEPTLRTRLTDLQLRLS